MLLIDKLLYESHLSSSKLFENSVPELDYLVELLNSDDEVLGARLTGGGFGGAVLAWTTPLFSQERASSIAQKYSDKFEFKPKFHSFNPSCGAHPKDPLDKG